MAPDPDGEHRRERRGMRARRRRPWLRAALAGLLLVLAATAGPVALLAHVNPPLTAFMLQADLAARRAGRDDFRLRRQWVDYEAIAPAAAIAVVAAEDQKFPRHAGFDAGAIRAALAEQGHGEAGGGRLRGASTLSQQVAKNLFLWPGRSWLRKGLEAGFTVLIERLWDKRRILEVYLNVAQFGDGIYGVEAAAREFFGKGAADLREDEAALLAAVLPNPVRLRADAPSAYLRGRQAWIATQARQLGGPAYLRDL